MIKQHLRFVDDILGPVGRDVGRIKFHVHIIILGERHERLGEGGDELLIVVGRGVDRTRVTST